MLHYIVTAKNQDVRDRKTREVVRKNFVYIAGPYPKGKRDELLNERQTDAFWNAPLDVAVAPSLDDRTRLVVAIQEHLPRFTQQLAVTYVSTAPQPNPNEHQKRIARALIAAGYEVYWVDVYDDFRAVIGEILPEDRKP